MSEFHVEVGAYALDALDESERPAFEEHLAGCEECQRELAEFTETTARLGALGDVAPPPALRGSLLDAIREVRPLPPLIDPPVPAEAAPETLGRVDPVDVTPRRAATPTAGRPVAEPGTMAAGQPGQPGADAPVRADPVQAAPGQAAPGQADPGHADPGQASPGQEAALETTRHGADDTSDPPGDELVQRRRERDERKSRRSRLLTLAVAAVTVIALGFGGWAFSLHRQQQVVASQAAAANQLLSAPDVRTYPVTVDGTAATFVVSKALDKAMFVGSALPAAQAGKTYQLWTLDGKEATPDVTFPGGPNTAVFMTGDVSGASGVAITTEPEGGSTKPSGTPVAATL